MRARRARDRLDEPIPVDLAAVNSVQAAHLRRRRGRRVLQQEQHDGNEFRLASSSAASDSAAAVGGAPTMIAASKPAAVNCSSRGGSSPRRWSTTVASGHSISTCFLTSNAWSARAAISKRRRLTRARVYRTRTDLSPRPEPSRRCCLASSDRSPCRRFRYSGVTSPVTYSPEKQEVSKSLIFALS